MSAVAPFSYSRNHPSNSSAAQARLPVVSHYIEPDETVPTDRPTLRRDLGLAYKLAFVLAHTLREAMVEKVEAARSAKIAPRQRLTVPASVATCARPISGLSGSTAVWPRTRSAAAKVVVVIREKGGGDASGRIQVGKRGDGVDQEQGCQ